MMDTPKIYVADLEAYNSGRLVGKWFELDDYSSAEELMEAITEYMTSLGKEEYAIHDIENLPRSLYDEYMGEKDFEKIYEILDKAKEMDLPFEVVAEVAREYSLDAVDGFQGKYDDMSDFAYRMVEDLGMESFTNPSFLYVSETDKRIIAGEEGDNYVNDIADEDDGERIIEEADMDLDEYREANEETRSEMVEKAKEVVSESIYDEWYNGLDDPYYFLVEEKGIYSPEDLKNVSFVQLDYDKIGQELEYDYNTVEYDGDVYVFSQNYGKGGFLSSIFGGGKKKYNRSWHQDHSQVNKMEKWERQDNMRHGKKARNRFMDGGQMSMFMDGGYMARGGEFNRSWHQDHYRVNKAEKWESNSPMRHGKTAHNRYAKGGKMSGIVVNVYSTDLKNTLIMSKSFETETKAERFAEKVEDYNDDGYMFSLCGYDASGKKVVDIEDLSDYSKADVKAEKGFADCTTWTLKMKVLDLRNTMIFSFTRSFDSCYKKFESLDGEDLYADVSGSKYAKGGRTKSYKYIPNKDIESITITQGEGSITIPNDNILDGAYIRRRYKAFNRGGNTGNYNYGRSYFQDRARFAKGQEYEVQYRKHK